MRSVGIQGTCEHMCPDSEIERRLRIEDVALFERPDPAVAWTDRALAVKRFARNVRPLLRFCSSCHACCATRQSLRAADLLQPIACFGAPARQQCLRVLLQFNQCSPACSVSCCCTFQSPAGHISQLRVSTRVMQLLQRQFPLAQYCKSEAGPAAADRAAAREFQDARSPSGHAGALARVFGAATAMHIANARSACIWSEASSADADSAAAGELQDAHSPAGHTGAPARDHGPQRCPTGGRAQVPMGPLQGRAPRPFCAGHRGKLH